MAVTSAPFNLCMACLLLPEPPSGPAVAQRPAGGPGRRAVIHHAEPGPRAPAEALRLPASAQEKTTERSFSSSEARPPLARSV
ncbi:hypothetical protein BKA18_003971 [Streptomyces auratus]